MDGFTDAELDAVVSMSWLDGVDAPPGKTCAGPVVIHQDGVAECIRCWHIASAHHGPDSVTPCDCVPEGAPKPGWVCDRCRG